MSDGVEGFTIFDPDQIYLRYCPCTLRAREDCVVVLAHELIHVEHPHWAHSRVYYWDDWYARTVVRPKLLRIFPSQEPSSLPGGGSALYAPMRNAEMRYPDQLLL